MPYNLSWDAVEEHVLELMPQRHGFPLRDPGIPHFGRASAGFKEYRSTTGPQVGDVGMLGPGSFMPFFNIFLTKDHPLNSKCPSSFVPCTASCSTRVTEQYLPPGTEINTMRSVPYGSTSDGTSAVCEAGAILKLPNGIRRIDTENIESVRNYAIENAPLWIKEGYVSYEDIYLVTGADLTNSWESFLQHAPRQLFFQCQDPKGRTYHTELQVVDSPHARTSTGTAGVSLEHYNQSFQNRILRRANELIPIEPSVLWTRPEIRPLPGTFRRFLFDFRRRIARLGPVYKIEYPPQFHPLTAVNRMLLSQNPFAFVVVTHDEDWISVMNEDDTVAPSPLTLIKRFKQNFEQIRYKDGVYLGPRPHHELYITTLRALTLARASGVETDGEAEAVFGDTDTDSYLLASITLSADMDSGLRNVAQAALNFMQATVRVEVWTRSWTLLASRFISAIALMTRLLADEKRIKDAAWDKALRSIESLLDSVALSIQNQAGFAPRSRLLSEAASLGEIIYFNTQLTRVLELLKLRCSSHPWTRLLRLQLPRQAEIPAVKTMTRADIDRTVDAVTKKFQS